VGKLNKNKVYPLILRARGGRPEMNI